MIDRLACPHDQSALSADGETLRCAEGHEYPYVDGIPVLLTANNAVYDSVLSAATVRDHFVRGRDLAALLRA